MWVDSFEGLKKSFVRRVRTKLWRVLKNMPSSSRVFFFFFSFCRLTLWRMRWAAATWKGFWRPCKETKEFTTPLWWSRLEWHPQIVLTDITISFPRLCSFELLFSTWPQIFTAKRSFSSSPTCWPTALYGLERSKVWIFSRINMDLHIVILDLDPLRTYRQLCGIPQGCSASTLLCCLCYGHMENVLFQGMELTKGYSAYVQGVLASRWSWHSERRI